MSRNYLEQGNQLKRQGQLTEAAISYAKAIEHNPSCPWPYYYFAETLAKIGKFDEALSNYRQAINLKSNSALMYSGLGAVLIKKGQFNEATKALQQAIQINSDLPWTHFFLATALKQQNRLNEAIIEYQKAIELYPNCQFWHDLGFVFLLQNNLNEAVFAFKSSIELKPKYSLAYHHLGGTLRNQGKIDEAIACYNRAIELNPNFFASHLNLGDIWQKQGELELAIAAYREGIKLNPNFLPAHQLLIKALAKQGKLNQAIRECETFLENKKSADIEYLLGDCLYQNNQFNRAIKAFQQVIKLNPNRAEYYWKLGLSLYQINESDEAIEYQKKALNIDSRIIADEANYLGLILVNKAKLLFETGKLEQAKSYCEKITSILDPYHANSLALLGKIYEAKGELKEANNYYRQASVLTDFSAKNNIMLICFRSRFGSQGGSFRYEFKRISSKFNVKKIFLRDIQSVWYNKGLLKITNNILETANEIKNYIREKQVERVVMTGVSAGGYVALVIGCILNVDKVHAFNPQTIVPNNPYEEKVLAGIDNSYFDVKDVMENRKIKTNFHIHFDKFYERDKLAAERLSNFQNVTLHGYPANVGHNIAGWLKRNGKLSKIFESAIYKTS